MVGTRLQLLGGFSAWLGSGEPVTFPTKKTKALLSYLCVTPGKRHTREKLAALLWEDSRDEQARANLRQTLTYLRKALVGSDNQAVSTDGDTVALNPEVLDVDVVDFEKLAVQNTPAALERAADLYQGEFLEGFDVGGEEFEAWQRSERQRLRELAVEALNKLLGHHAAASDSERAVQAAMRLLAIEPLREDVHRALIRIRLGQGQRALALKHYEECRALLSRELGTEPDPETERLVREIRKDLSEPASHDAASAAETPPPELGTAVSPLSGRVASQRSRSSQSHLGLIGAVAATIAIVAVGAVWMNGTLRDVETETVVQVGLFQPPPKGPSIAVLPFRNMSADPGQDYFADGLAEDLITDLSKLRALFVIARESSFAYKGEAVDVRQIGRELGVRHILEGSVRKVGNQVRITAQLVDASTGNHLWAQRYDRPLSDVFAVQDEIRTKIMTELEVALVEGEQARAWRKSGTSNVEAYDLFLRAKEALIRFSKPTTYQAIEMLKQVVALDPNYARAWVTLGWAYDQTIWSGWTDNPAKTTELAFAAAHRALEVNDESGWAHSLLGSLTISYEGDHEKGVAELEKAMALNPNGADVQAIPAFFLPYVGKGEEAVTAIKKAMRLNPHPPDWYFSALGAAYLGAERYEESIGASRECVARMPDHMMCNLRLILALMATGREDEGRRQAKEVLRINPNFSVSGHFSDYAELATGDPAVKERRTGFLRSAGLPE